MVPIGYIAKVVVPKPEWLKANGVEDIFSVSLCISDQPFEEDLDANSLLHNVQNTWGLFNIATDITALAELESTDISRATIFELPPKFRLPGGGVLTSTDWKEKRCSRYRSRSTPPSSRKGRCSAF